MFNYSTKLYSSDSYTISYSGICDQIDVSYSYEFNLVPYDYREYSWYIEEYEVYKLSVMYGMPNFENYIYNDFESIYTV